MQRNAELRSRAAKLRAEGIRLEVVPDALRAAEVAQKLGMCDAKTVKELRSELQSS